MKALINASVYDFENYADKSYVLFDTNIEEVGHMEDFKGADEIYDCRDCVVIPGLVNCHTHIYSTFSRGMNVPFDPKSFKDILEQLWWKLDSCLDNDSVFYSGLVYGIDCIKNGVTTIIDHHASGIDITGSLAMLKESICNRLGMRGIFCFETSDRFDVAKCIDENIRFSRDSTEYYAGLFGMHASMSLGDDTLKLVASRIGSNPIHIHVAESREDVTDCRSKYKKGIVERLDSFGLLNKNSILAHCVHIGEDEADIIKKRGCSVVLNPTSNMNNAVGLADFDVFRNHNINCMLGNDGLGAGMVREYQNIVFVMKNRLGSPVKFGLDDLLKLINNGYEYAGNILNIKIGRIQKGYRADMITVPYIPPTPMDEGNASSHMFFGLFDRFNPRDMWVSGKNLMKDYVPVFDTQEVYRKSRVEALKVWSRVQQKA